jgi:hypothetical protein
MKTGEIVGMEELEEFSFFRSSEFGKFLRPFHSSDNITTMGVGGFPDEKNDQDELRLEFGRNTDEQDKSFQILRPAFRRLSSEFRPTKLFRPGFSRLSSGFRPIHFTSAWIAKTHHHRWGQ